MTDIVRILHALATDRQMEYHYGKKAALNLLDGTLEENKIFLLHEFTNRTAEYNSTATKIIAHSYTGKFFLVKHSAYGQHYFAEAGTAETSKYTQNIEPLLAEFNALGNSLACTGAEVQQWENVDVTDALDANMDGLLCTYTIRIPYSHEQ
ncbi:hypothetical protein AM493_13930 [Flavobacterium akiainvivens]|uniref:Uncharacterized protein n=1 Tax=Flavobacterium akiainvivens TaxID=1202724 RepID=A0A0M9VJ23_9FLAO|nr:hypothetical protein [Flavobacterium akiainvivens]KOS07009.1 hypothetical protein AM493_13930 [Flavobacterium akiainvivens]SFQ59251.1 hypothetical protein SAMN05444144_10991 [Flavobacterium akiainvivens]